MNDENENEMVLEIDDPQDLELDQKEAPSELTDN